MKRIPVILLSTAVTGLPVMLSYYRGQSTTYDAQIVAGLGLAVILTLGIFMVAYRTILTKDPKTTSEDVPVVIVMAVVFALFTAFICEVTMWVMPLSGLLVLVLVSMAAYACFRPFFDRWTESVGAQ